MTEGELQVVRAGVFVAAMLLAGVVQRVAPHARLRGSWRVNGGLWLVNVVVVGLVCGACACTAARWGARHGIGFLRLAGIGAWASIPASIAALDLVSYGWHRANHRIPFLWRFHRVHHSDPTFTVSTGIRFHPGELLLSLPLRVLAVVLVGASVEAVLVFEGLFTVANLLEHGDIALSGRVDGVLARALVTPAVHRRHHTRTGPARDSNFGTIFSLWDRFLGTYSRSDAAARVDTGLPDVGSPSLGAALLLPARRLSGGTTC